jgi:tRNA(adenine34) deaminase
LGLHEDNMRKALAYAETAAQQKEVPVGAIIVDADNVVIGWGYNDREQTQQATGHAELNAIAMAARHVGSWRLEETTMYVTLEPCAMCSGAILQSRIPRIFFGAYDPKAGCAGSVVNLFNVDKFNHRPEIVGGLLEETSRAMLQQFFKELRTR